MIGLNLTELVELALMLVAVGAVSGFFAGIFGIGGGAILVPVFYECFRLAGVPLINGIIDGEIRTTQPIVDVGDTNGVGAAKLLRG